MISKQVIATLTLAFAASAAMAGEITVATETFVPMKTRAEVKAEVLQAHAAGVTSFVNEIDGYVAPAAKGFTSTLTREQVRAELRNTPRQRRLLVSEAA